MEPEIISPEDASAVTVPLVESITNTGSEGMEFPQINGNDVKYPLVEETRKADGIKTDVVSETRPEEIYQESSKNFVESEGKTEQQPEGRSMEKKILRHADSELIKMEPIPKLSGLEDESTSSTEVAINQNEIAQKFFGKETYYKEEPPATDIDQSCKPQNELEQTSKILEEIDLTQYTGRDTADKEHTDHQFEAHSTGEDTKEKHVIENDGKLDEEEAKGIEDPTKTQLLYTQKESVAEDEALQTLPIAAPVRNEAVDERSKEEIQPEAELVVTYTKEMQTPQHEFNENKDIPEEVEREHSAANENKLEYQPVAQNEETTFIKESHSDEDIAEINSTHDTEKQVPVSDTNEKLLIKIDGKLNQEEAKQIEDPQRSEPKNEALQTLPTAGSVENEAIDESSQEDIQPEAEAMTYTNEVQTSKDEFNVKRDIPEEETELSAENEQGSESQPIAQSEENTILKQPHLNEDTAEINPINETEEQGVPASEAKEKLVIEDEGNFYQDSAKQIEDSAKSVSEDEALKTLPTATSVKNEAVDESSQEIQLEAKLAVTYTKEGEREELSAENEQELESHPAAQNEENTIIKHPHMEDETIEINPTNETEEQEVPASDSRDILVIEDDGKFNQEEARQIEDPTKSVNEDESIQILPAVASVKNEAVVAESIHREIKPEVQLEVTYIKEDEMELTAENKEELEREAATQTEKTTTVKVQQSNEETEEINTMNHTAKEVQASNRNDKLVIGHDGKPHQEEAGVEEDEYVQPIPIEAVDDSNQEEKQQEADIEVTYTNKDETELSVENTHESEQEIAAQTYETSTEKEAKSNEEIAGINTINDTLASDENEKLVIEDVRIHDQEEATQIQEPTKSLPEDEFLQTLPTAASVENEVFNEALSQKEQALAYVLQDETELSAENKQKSERQAEAQTKENTIINETHSNEETEEIKTINYTAEQEEIPAGNVNEKLVINCDGKIDQEEAEQVEDPTKTLPEDESLQTLTTKASIENEAVNEAPAKNEQTTTVKETHSNEEASETNPIDETAEQVKVPKSKTNEKLVIKDEDKLDQGEAELIEEPTKSLPEDEFLQTLPTAASIENEVFNEALAQKEQATAVKETYLNEETAEQEKLPTSDTNEKPVITDDSKDDRVEAERIEDPIKSLQEDEPVQTIKTRTLVEDEAVDESSQEVEQQEVELEVTYTNEDESELCAEKKHESDPEAAAQTEGTSTVKEEHSNKENIKINHIDDTLEQEVPAGNVNEKRVIEDDDISDQVETQQIEEQTKCVPEDESLQTLPTATSVGNKTVYVSGEEQHQAAELEVTYTEELQPLEKEIEAQKHIPEDETELSAENKLQSERQAEAQTKENTIINETHSNEETEEIKTVNYTAEQEEIPADNVNEKLVINYDGKNDQEEAEQVEDPTKSLPEDESLQTLTTTASIENEAVNEAPAKNEQTTTVKETHSNEEASETNPIDETAEQVKVPKSKTNEKLVIKDEDKLDQGEAELIEEPTKSMQEDETVQTLLTTSTQEKHQEAELEETYTNEVQTQQNEVKAKMHISEDETELSGENTQESQLEATTQTKETTTVKEVPSNQEIAEVNPIHDTAEQEDVPASDVNEKLVIEEDSKLDQEEAILIEESTKSIPEDDFVQTLPTATLIENEEVDESSQEEKHQKEELAVTYTKEVQTKQNEFDAKKDLLKDVTELSAKNNQESEAEAAAQTKETTSGNELLVNEETAQTNHINHTSEQEEFPVPDVNEKLVIEDDSKINQEEVEQIEEPKISVEEDEYVQPIPIEAVDDSNQEEKQQEADIEVTYTNKDETELSVENTQESEQEIAAQTYETSTEKEAKLNEEIAGITTINDTLASDENEKLVIEDVRIHDQEEATQIQEPTKSLPEDEFLQTLPTAASIENEAFNEALAQKEQATTVKETYLNEETAEQEKLPTSDTNEKPVITDDSKVDQVEAERIEDPIKSLQEDEPVQTITTRTRTLVEDEAVDESSQEVEQQEVELEVTYTNEDESELCAEKKHESDPEAAAQTEGTSTVKEEHYNKENIKINHIDDTSEQEVPAGNMNEKRVMEDDHNSDQVETEQIEEQKKCVPEDESLQTLPTATSVGNKTVYVSGEEQHQGAELEVTYTEELQTLEIEIEAQKHIPEVDTELSAENKQQSERQAEAQTKENTIINETHSNEETEEIKTVNYTAEQEEIPAGNVNEKLVINYGGKNDQEEAERVEDPTKSLPEDESLQTLTTTASIENEAVNQAPAKNEQTTTVKETHSNEEASETNPIGETAEQVKVPKSKTNEKLVIKDEDKLDQGEAELIEEPTKSMQEDETVQTLPTTNTQEKHQEAELEETYTNEVQTQQNEVKAKMHISEDETELSGENTQESQLEATTQTKETTTVKEVPSNQEIAEVNPIHDTAEQEDVPASDVNEKLVIEDDSKLDQEEAILIEESTKSIPEDDFVQTLPTATLVENEEVDESSQEEKHQKEELAVTYTKEVQTKQNEFDAKKDLLKDVTELSAKNNQESEAEAAAQTKETTSGNELLVNEETAQINHINHTSEQEEFPVPDVNEKLVIEDDSKINQEEVEQIEEPKISVPEDESVQTLPSTASVGNKAVDGSEEQCQEAELEATYTEELQTQNEKDAKKHIPEDEMELSAENKQEPEREAAAQTKENTILKEAHSNEETVEINTINDTAEQKEIPAGNVNEKLVIDDDGKNDQEEAEQIEDPTNSLPEDESFQTLTTAASIENEAVDEAPKNEQTTTVKETSSNEEASETNPIDETAEQEKFPTSDTNEKLVIKDDDKLDQGEAELIEEPIKSVQEDEYVKTSPTTTSVEREAIDDSSQEKHQQAELEKTYTNKVQIKQSNVKAKMHISEDETELSAENTQESQSEAAAQRKETTTVKELLLNEETAEVNPTNDTAEQEEVPASDVNEKLVIEDDSKLDQEVAEQIEESTKSVPKDDFAQILPTRTLVKHEEVDESIHEEKHQEEDLAVTYTKEDEMEVSAKNNQEYVPEAAAQTEEITTEKELHSNEENAEINPINDTTEQEVFPASDMNEKLVLEDDGEIDREEVELINEPTKIVLEDESLQTLSTITSIRNIAVDESSEGQHQEAELEVTHTDKLQTQHNEIDAKMDIPKDETEIIAENKEELEPEAAAPIEETTTVKDLQSNEETAETNPINDTLEQEVPAPNVNDKPVIDNNGKLDQEEAKQTEEPTKSLPEDESLQTMPTIESAENEAVDDSSEDIQLEVAYRKEQEMELSAENKQESEPEAAAQNKETTKVKEPPSNEETAKVNPINDTAELEVPASNVNEKLVIEDDGKLDQEEAKQIEEPTKSFLEDELLQTIPATASVENEAVDETSKQIQPDVQLQVTYPKELQAAQNEFNAKKDFPEDVMELSADNKQKSEPKAAAQNEETTTKKELHSNEETTEINPINDTAKQVEIPASEANEKLLIVNDGQLDQEEMKQTEEPSKDEPLQSLATTASVQNEAVDESSQEETRLDTQLEVTYTKEVQTPNNEFNTKNDIPEDETELSAENKQEIEPEVASQSEETTTVKELYSNEETAEIKPIMAINDTVEQEVPAFDANEKLVFQEDGKLIQEEAKDNEEQTKSFPEDESLQSLFTGAAVKNEAVDESSHGEIQPEAQLPVRYTKEDGSEFRAENKLKSESQVAARNDEATTVNQLHLKETAEINHTDDTEKKEVQPSNANEKLVIEDPGKLDQDKAKQLQKATKNESVQTLPTATSVQNGAAEESSQEEIQPEAELEVTYAKEVQTPQIEFHAKKDILEDDPELSAENKQKSAPLAATQTKISTPGCNTNETKPAVTDTKEDHRSDYDLAKNVEVLEAFDLQKAPGNSCVENEDKALIQSEAKNQETVITKHPSLEGPDTQEISPSTDTNELEKENEVAKHRGVSESVSIETTEQTDTITTGKEAISRDIDIKTDQTDTRKLETQETTQFNSAKEDEVGQEFEKISPSSSISVISRDSQDTNMKILNKKSHGILSGVGSKVKHSISKVKKAITGKSSHQKTALAKENN